jgi:hypothetical protein
VCFKGGFFKFCYKVFFLERNAEEMHVVIVTSILTKIIVIQGYFPIIKQP